MTLVYLASPLSGEVALNVAYARMALRDSLSRGESPYAPHLLLPQALDDEVPAEREAGMRAGAAWLGVCDTLVAYVDLGVSRGMAAEIEQARKLDIPIVERRLFPMERTP